MSISRTPAVPLALLIFGAGCGGDTSGPTPPLPTPSEACAAVATTTLAVGEHVVIDPSTASGCLRLPQAGPAGAQYLLVLASTTGARSSTAILGPYLLRASNPGPLAVATSLSASVEAEEHTASRPSVAREFDARLRQLERELSADPGARFAPGDRAPGAALTVGDVKAFQPCNNLTCSAFTTVQATLRFVGTHAAVYIDNTVPQNDPLQDADFAELGTSFDNRHYPIDTTAFGRESDIDNNGIVEILMTDAVNNLTPDCTNGRVVGYFFGSDLLNTPNSNHGEVFYTLVPAPAHGTCKVISRRSAVDNLKPTLIHELDRKSVV